MDRQRPNRSLSRWLGRQLARPQGEARPTAVSSPPRRCGSAQSLFRFGRGGTIASGRTDLCLSSAVRVVSQDHMKTCGQVTYCDLMLNAEGRSKGCGLVEYSSAEEAAAAVKDLTDTAVRRSNQLLGAGCWACG